MNNIKRRKIPIYLITAILCIGMVSECKKKDCNGPCELLSRCAKKIGVATKEMNMLAFGCKDVCAKYRDPVNTCYTMAIKASNECVVMAQCVQNVYKSGKY